jgi:adenylate cyclase
MKDLEETIERMQIERLRLIGLLEEHLSPDLVAEILEGTRKLRLGGARETVTVLFCDLRGFTRFTSSEDPDRVVGLLNQFFHVMTTVLFAHGATVDKFIGDSIMAFFRKRDLPDRDPVAMASACAREMQIRFTALSANWEIGKSLGLGIGLSLGEVILGHVGSGKHVDFTVIGSPVNLASRLCALAGAGEILASEAFVREISKDEGWEPLQPQKIKGFDEPVSAFVTR